MIRDFKAQIFCREANVSRREIDTADPVWSERIDAFLRQRSLLPPENDPTEYAAAFEAVYPQARHRRQYIENAIAKGTACFGQKTLGSLIAAGKVDCVFTTNFDPLVEEATVSANAQLPLDAQVRPTVAAIDSAERAMRCLNESAWPLIAKLHGDYQSIAIKNTGTELERQDERMRHVLVEAGKRFGMMFVGYSGRDASIMEALGAILEGRDPFPSGLYWMTSSASRLLPAVTQFLSRAHAAGVDVAIVECATFDELASDILSTVDLIDPLCDWVMAGRPAPRLVPVQLPTAEARSYPVLRYSSLLIEAMPRTARRVTLSRATTTPEMRTILKEKGCRATVAANGKELAVFGNDEEILAALAPYDARLAGEVELNPGADSWALGLLYEALVRALGRRRPLIPRYERSGHSLVVARARPQDPAERARRDKQILARLRSAYNADLTGRVPKLGLPFQEGVFLKLEQVNACWWCGFEPYTFVQRPRGETVSEADAKGPPASDPMGQRPHHGGDPAGDWRRERWAQRYNRNWASIIDAWAQLLTAGAGGRMAALGLADGAGIDAVFEISPVTGWSRPSHHHAYFNRSK
ncbi:SIR2 family protein [Novosphingobium profundi]|nr:SIR2 family protein [Novosphingobium profundi]